MKSKRKLNEYEKSLCAIRLYHIKGRGLTSAEFFAHCDKLEELIEIQKQKESETK